METIKKIYKDILYVSKLTKIKNKKLLIFFSILLSQLTAGTDLLLIGVFAAIIANQFTNIEILNSVLDLFIENKILIVAGVFFRYFVNYLQFSLLKRLEIDVIVSLKEYMFNKILEQKNYSTADTFYYLNTLSVHISFFYSNFAQFVIHLLQSGAYIAYLLIADVTLISYFGIGVLILSLPIYKLISAAREYMHKFYSYGKDANKDLVNAVENLPLIKILRMEEVESSNFARAVKNVYEIAYKNYQVGFFNTQLPNFFTLFVFSIILNFTRFTGRLTLDFLGVTIRMFQSLSNISSAVNQVVNSQIHIEEFVAMEKANGTVNPNYLSLDKVKNINLKEVHFKYTNSEEYIFENLNISFERDTHNVIIGSNGTGKSTLLGLLGNVLIPEKGTLSTFTEDFSYIGATPFIFQKTLKENIMYGNKLEISNSEILEMLHRFDTFKEKSSYDINREIDNNSLSSGQMQKVGFIRALLSNPDVLILDEAMANLDEKAKQLVLSIIKEKQITVINSTHDPERYEDVDTVTKLEIVDEKRVIRNIN